MASGCDRPPPRFELRSIPKRAGGLRWLAELDPATDRRYRLAVAPTVARIERMLAPGVLANRASPGGRLRPPGPARSRWRRALRHAAATHRTVMLSDVVECYASIEEGAVAQALARTGAASGEIRGVLEVLKGFHRAGLRGLPVGPEASAMLANAVLAPADEAVRGVGGDIVRWVDDVALIGPDRRTAVRSFDAWAATLRELGLRPHDGKTRLLLSPEVAEGGPAGNRASCRDDRHGMMPAP